MPEPDPSASMLRTLDGALRGHYLRPELLAAGRVEMPVARLVGLGLVLGCVYGASLGTFALFSGAGAAWQQVAASAWKVPLLFVLTLVVTFPSLYVFAALQRLPLAFDSTLRLLLLAIVVHVAVLASLAPVFAFFAASTESYPFMLLLNVAFFAIGGLLGFTVLRRATLGMFSASAPATPGPADGSSPAPPATVRADRHGRARRLLGTWCCIYAIVGAQMGWLLRPFLGAPDQPFSLFRPRESNVFAGILQQIAALFGQ